MTTNPVLGVVLHAIGGLAAGSFYAPLKNVRQWSWESFWLVMGLAAWLVAPWVAAWLTTPELGAVLAASPARAWGPCILFGLLWGLGNLTFGLSVRYLGMALGFSVALGFCMTFGTLVPPLAQGKMLTILSTTSGLVILGGVVLCLAGISLCGWAGMSKEGELTEEQKRETVSEFALGKGFAVAAMSGVLSACFAFGLAAGKPIADLSVAHGTTPVFSNNAVLVVILIGGFVSNAIWCLILNIRNRSFQDYVTGPAGRQLRNYLLSVLGGVIWYGQFFFYGMGTTKLGERFDFSSWSIHMAFIIVFSNLWGIAFHEWRGTSGRTRRLVWLGILTLIISTTVIGYGNYLAE
jgi:L-rhamnose-H+ transport protein